MKKLIIRALPVVLLLLAAVIIIPGLFRTGTAFISDFSLSPSGDEISFTVAEGSSMGFVRSVSVHQQQGGRLYLDCWRAFGGLNGALGAKSSYTVTLDEDTNTIALYKARGCYQEVLRKNSDGKWERVS